MGTHDRRRHLTEGEAPTTALRAVPLPRDPRDAGEELAGRLILPCEATAFTQLKSPGLHPSLLGSELGRIKPGLERGSAP